MSTIRITKRFHFEMAHALLGYDGHCKNIHGHSYNLQITVMGEVVQKKESPKDGMVIDFKILKQIVYENIINKFDHSLMVNENTPSDQIELLRKSTDRLILVDFQPTSENIVTYLAEILQQRLPSDVKLYSIRLYETVTSFAEWFATDNQ